MTEIRNLFVKVALPDGTLTDTKYATAHSLAHALDLARLDGAPMADLLAVQTLSDRLNAIARLDPAGPTDEVLALSIESLVHTVDALARQDGLASVMQAYTVYNEANWAAMHRTNSWELANVMCHKLDATYPGQKFVFDDTSTYLIEKEVAEICLPKECSE